MFGGFKASLNILSGKFKGHSELTTDFHVTGAYRVNRENAYGFGYSNDAPKPKPSELPSVIRPVKSTGNLQAPMTVSPNLRNSNPAISTDPRGEEHSRPNANAALTRKEIQNRENEKKKIEKQRAAERKKQAQEESKQQKLREKARKQEQKAQKDAAKKQAKNTATPQVRSISRPAPQSSTNTPTPQTNTNLNQTTPNPQSLKKETNKSTVQSRPVQSELVHSRPKQPVQNTDTLGSSISRSSGPPPYSELPIPIQPKTDTTGNVAYSKPLDTGSWDMISQHREQMNRPVVTSSKRKQVLMDLNYLGKARDNADNSEA